jgi:two-component system heavy metal sensor histidine kinase CusS
LPRHPFYSSLRTKASFLFFGAFLVIILPVSYLIYKQVGKTLSEADDKELKAEAEKLASQVKLDPPVIPIPPLGYSMRIQHRSDFLFEEVFTSPGFPELPPEIFFLDAIDLDSVRIFTLQNLPAAPPGLVLSLSRSNARLTTQLNELKLFLFAANAASILLAGILVFLAAGIMLRPIRRIADVAERINASNSIERVPVPRSNDESRQLAEALNAMLARIEDSIKNQVRFFASATHELKTPLAVMQAELSLAKTNVKDAEVRKLLESQLVEVQRLDRIIHDFLLISQLKSETLSIRKRDECLDEVLFAAIRKVKYLAQEREANLKIVVDENHTPHKVSIDFDKIETVFSNLIENAILYSPPKSLIDIVIKDHHVVISNPLDGAVLNTENLKSEFNRSAELSSGLGMGLWLSDQIIKLHEGKLQLVAKNKVFEATVIF